MRADDVVARRAGHAGQCGDQVGDGVALVVVRLGGDFQPGGLEGLVDIAPRALEAVARERRAPADLDGQDLDVPSQRLFEVHGR